MGRNLKLDDPIPLTGLRLEFCRKLRDYVGSYGAEEIANRLGVSKTFVYQMVKGTKSFEINNLPAWAKALGLKSWKAFFK